MSNQPNARTISQHIISGLKISGALVGAGVALLICLNFVPVHRIEAYYWHLRYGTSIDVGKYRFPVPKQWYVERQSADDVLLVDLKTGDAISVRTPPRPKATLAAWSALMSRRLPDGSMKTMGQKELQLDGEALLCIEQDFDAKAFRLYPIECRSDGALEVTFTPYISSGNGHEQMFYSLLQQVRKF